VGYRLALRLRARIARRHTVPIPMDDTAQADTGHDQELRWALDEEVDRLPENYRAVVILCCWEGKTRPEAARLLGCKEGAVKIRLERARAMLRTRLARRGFSVPGAMLSGTLAASSGSVPPSLAAATVTAARCFAVGQTTAVSATAAKLAEGVLKTMMLSQWKWAALLALALGVFGTSAGLWARVDRPAVRPLPSERVALAPAPLAAKDVPEKEPDDGLPRGLLFAAGATRDYQFVRSLFVREADRKRAELSIYLQGGTARGIVQDVPPERLLARFPSRFQKPDDKEDPEKRYDNLARYNVLIAFDPDWTQLTADQVKSLNRWVRTAGHGLIFVAGPVNTFQLTLPADQEKLKPLIDLLPVQLADIRKVSDAGSARPSPLVFSAAADDLEFLKLDPDRKGTTAGWSEFFHGTADAKPDDPIRHGFFSSYPVKKARPGAAVVATFGEAAGEPYLVVQSQGRGRVIYLGSGEMWRLRQYRESYHERFWEQLVRYAATGKGLSR
jgi:hypothetical protein